MNLFLMRHANAGLSRENPVLDAKRALIKEGKEQCILKVEISPALGLDADYGDFQQMLAKYVEYDGILAVGHNPNLFQFLGRLITGNGGAAIRMRKGSVARIDLDRHPPLLQWLIDPRSARAIYASVQKSSRPNTSRK
jgi:phosphohistidine phosphatase